MLLKYKMYIVDDMMPSMGGLTSCLGGESMNNALSPVAVNDCL